MAQARANQCASLPPRTPQRLPHRRRDWAESACCTRPLSFCPVWRSRDVGAARKCLARAGPSGLRYSSVHGRWVGGVRGWSTSEASLASSGESVVATMCSTQTSADERRRLEEAAACCNPVQHVATQCLQPSATNPVQHVATRSADERQRLVADRETFHTGECEMQHVRRARSGGRACIHGGVRSGTAAGGSPARG